MNYDKIFNLLIQRVKAGKMTAEEYLKLHEKIVEREAREIIRKSEKDNKYKKEMV